MINFEVKHELFKGFLLSEHQIIASSKRPDKVAEVEQAFGTWMRKIESALVQGNQLPEDTPDIGPVKELEKLLDKVQHNCRFYKYQTVCKLFDLPKTIQIEIG